tara:strand:- start:1242 stop:1706 length:465 start_codon:yes stop_codon:yes gene_type:complete
MPSFTLLVNNDKKRVTVDPDTPILWVLRDVLGLTGTKFGCGKGLCGTCTIHYQGNAVRSCTLPVKAALEGNITTIEGLSKEGNHPVQRAWMDMEVPQCGYCQSGQMMTAAALLSINKNPSDNDINVAMSGNICRCGTYGRIRKAIKSAASNLEQ